MGALALLRGVGESQVLETLVVSGNPKLSDVVAHKLLALLDSRPAFRYVETAGTGALLLLLLLLPRTWPCSM